MSASSETASGRRPISSWNENGPGCQRTASPDARTIAPNEVSFGAAIATDVTIATAVPMTTAGTRTIAERRPTGSWRTWEAPRPGEAGVPGRGAPLGGDGAPPVLDDEPEARKRRQHGAEPEVDDVEQRSRRQSREDREPEVVLVDPATKDVDPRPERMSLETEHLRHTVPRAPATGHRVPPDTPRQARPARRRGRRARRCPACGRCCRGAPRPSSG